MPFRLALPGSALALLTALVMACGGDDIGEPLSPTETLAPEATATVPVAEPSTPPVCEGEGISNIERAGQRRYEKQPEMVIDPSKTYVAEVETSKGVITIELAAQGAPVTTNNFVFLSCNGYYD